ncbi:uncharacterized protein LOC126831638 [Patella vulgata]|uniref:uncharacterized protein LOC126831638 n=1 Tax=Patella vulgata TaxID=6465 RepID=UPI0024A94E34|nr:uncharacterized protein LOC126831638 [Patella vulgata]
MEQQVCGAMEQNLAERTADSILKKYSEEQIIQELCDLNLNVVSSSRANYNTLRQYLFDIILKHPDPDQELRRIKARILSEKARATSEADRQSLDPQDPPLRQATPPANIEEEEPGEEQLEEDHQLKLNPDLSPEFKQMISCIEQLREEQSRQREDMVELLKTLSAQQSRSHPSSPSSSRHESDISMDPQVIDRRYEQYVSNAHAALKRLEKELQEDSIESNLDLADEKAQVNVGKLITFVEQCIFPQDYSMKRERQLQQTSILEKDFDEAHRQAKLRIRSLQKKEEQRKRQSFLSSSIKVPSYYGDVLDFASWISEFDQLVHFNADVHDQGKLKALKESLKGTAASTLTNFDIIGKNYTTAYNLVRKRFGKPRLLIHHEVESIVKIPELKDDATSYRKCLEQMETRSTNLSTLKADMETVLVGLVVPKFTRTLRMSWERHLKSHVNDDACASMRDLLDFLQVETELLEASSNIDKLPFKQINEKAQRRQNSKRHMGSAQSLAITSKKKVSSPNTLPLSGCSFCAKAHALDTCSQFSSLDQKDRLIHVFTARICRSCLEPFGGPKHSCGKTCPICSQRHHELLHDGYLSTPSRGLPAKQPTPRANVTSPNQVSLPSVLVARPTSPDDACAALPVLQAKITYKEKTCIVNIGMDSFSEKSFITKDIVDTLHLPVSKMSPLVVAGFGGLKTELHEATTFDLTPLQELQSSSFKTTIHIDAIIRDGDICDPVTPVHLHPNLATVCEQYPLARAPLDQSVRIHVLLGACHVVSSMRVVAHLDKDGPCILSTPFGYTIGGSYRNTSSLKTNQVNSCLILTPKIRILDTEDAGKDPTSFAKKEGNIHLEEDTINLDKQLERHMTLESWGLGTQECTTSNEDEMAIQKFKESVFFDHCSGHYEVALPFREESLPLKDNMDVVLKIMLRTERQLLRSPEKMKMYNEAMDDYVKRGFAKELSEDEVKWALNQEHMFLPHHPVIKDSVSTALRVVFNASHKASPEDSSLNEALLPGPKLQPDLCQILLRFRINRFAVAGDVTKMFCMTNLAPAHWRYQLYLWRGGDTTISPKIYAMVTLMFGVTSSPYLAIQTMRHHLDKYSQSYSDEVNEIRENMYVDDFLFGGSDEDQVQELCHNSIKILSEGGWQLRKFSSNSQHVLESLSPEQRMTNSLISFDDEEKLEAGISTTLGLVWDTRRDTFGIKVMESLLKPAKKVTKRVIVSRFSSIFDVFGFVGPFTLQMKIIVQKLWKQKYDWDEPVPKGIESEYRIWESELHKLNEIWIPRWTYLDPAVLESQLCGFADASSYALGGVIFLRVVDTTGGIRITFLMAKSKVAPVKAVTIARLELVAALLLSKMITFIKEAFTTVNPDVHLWTDSSIVISWLSRPSYDWKTYVRNRVQKIQELTSGCEWHHIPGIENPADIHSRGSNLSALMENDLYWKGPYWLQLPISSWQSSTPTDPEEEELAREKASTTSTSLLVEITHSTILDKSNDYHRCLRLAGFIRRWLNTIKQRKSSRIDSTIQHQDTTVPSNRDLLSEELEPLSSQELKESEDGLLRYTQWMHFPLEYEALMNGGKLPKESRLTKFKPVWDKNRRLIVAQGRLTFSNLHPEAKQPVILPSKDKLVELLILHVHQSRSHAPQDHTVNLLRNRYAILHCRQSVRSVLRHCVQCRHYNAPPVSQQMGSLPECRTGSIIAPFDTLGVDYTGAITVKAPGGKTIKAYILIGTCAQTRMCHLELTTGMSTEATLGGLRHIINRRGMPRRIISDNAKYFIKCSQVVKSELQHYATSHGINWEFIVDRAPHRGAFWERLIRSMKEPLRKIIGNSMLTWEEMLTILSDVERHLNSRPLTYTGSDVNNPRSITPAHLAFGRSLEQLQEAPAELKSLNDRYRLQRDVLQQFWERWESEYLPNLLPLQKWYTENEPLQENDVVLITEDNTRRPQWRMARVIEGIPSRDGIVRTYRLQTSTSELKRPAQRLRLLEKHSPIPLMEAEDKNCARDISSADVVDLQRDLSGECNDVPPSDEMSVDVLTKTRCGRTVRRPLRFDQ